MRLEILPERNIIQRLWLEPVANGIEPQTALHKMHWIADDNKLTTPPNDSGNRVAARKV